MDFEWIAIALGDVTWISLAFALGLLSKLVKLPPMVGFLIAGFVLNAFGVASGEMLQKLADLGITLLLFTVGLKLDIKSLARPQVWGTTLIHMSIITSLFGGFIFLLAVIGTPLFIDLELEQSLLLAFALSFSSTVFAVKVLEERGDMNSRHGRIAIGVLIMQDLLAVVFLAATSGKLPTVWALLLLLLIPVRASIKFVLERTGHGELLILFGLVLALGGSEIFELVGVKGDLGALIIGVLISTHVKSKELAESMLGFKDLFLVGFFLTIGMSGELTIPALLIGLALVPLIFIKSVLFMKIMTGLKLRSRTALFSTLHLSNYSEFGLIVAAVGVSNGWLDVQWLIVMVIALSVSFIVAAPINKADSRLYRKYRDFWLSMEHSKRLPGDGLIDTKGAQIAVFGMGRVGVGAYEELSSKKDKSVIGIDFNPGLVERHKNENRNAIVGNPGDPEFWEKINHNPAFEFILLALPNLDANLRVMSQLKEMNYPAKLAAVVHYADEEETLRNMGITAVYNIYIQAGVGFAEHAFNDFDDGEKRAHSAE
jgi:glutathione-regulated potassium-efflux system ancillary protein KefC